jgi:hypothetical protein
MSQQKPIVQYVMGELSEAEQLQIEEQYFADAAFLGEVQAVCADLIDAYLTGAMPVRDREQFEKRLHAIPFLREQVETSRVLLEYARTTAAERPVPVRKRRAAFAGWWASRPNFWSRLAWAGVVCGLLSVGLWYGRQSRPSEFTEANPRVIAQSSATPVANITSSVPASPTPTPTMSSPKPVPKPPVPPVIASLLLSADVTRSESQGARLLLPASNGQVLLQLELPAAQPPSYQATLQNAQGQTLRTWRKMVAKRHRTVSVVTLKVPAHLLSRGEYRVTLTSENATSYRFPFLVEPQ